jgi:hypothetical protein
VVQAGGLITPAQLLQNLLACRLTHVFIHSGQGNPTFGTMYHFDRSFNPLPGNKTFGAIRCAPLIVIPLAIVLRVRQPPHVRK